MAKKMLIDASHTEETRVVVVEGNKVEEFDFESLNKRQLAGNIYLAKVTRVEPSLQAAFVDYGGNRHGFLAFSEIHPDYYQIPVEDREALLAEEAEIARAQAEEDNRERPKRNRRRGRGRGRAKVEAESTGVVSGDDLLVSEDVEASEDDSGLVETPENRDESDVVEAQAEVDTSEAEVAGDDAEQAPAEGGESSEVDADAETEAKEADGSDDDDDDDDEDGDEDGDIESVAAEDVKEEISPRKLRQRRYKIQEVIKVRQILLVQVVKEERGNKGAALTTYLSLAGRYCVLMPNTARGGGISRKITNAADRKKLKTIAGEIEVPQGAGLIVRTAGAKRTKTEIKRDYEFLLRQWEQIRDRTFKSYAPALVYEEGSLIKRSIRDLYNREIDEILVEGADGYKEAKEYMKMLLPSHAKNVKLYDDPMALFARFQVESYLTGMFNPVVQLKSGGYIVIGITEALVAVDVNSGRATKEGSIEETALKTNLEASDEVARQMRLRDLAGLIVIDYIDMEERRNNNAVEKRLKDKLKTDRARIQVGRISGFGLLEMSRQRLRPGMLEATTAPCAHCHGTGLVRSDDSLTLSILREVEEEAVRQRSREVLVKVPLNIANYLLNQKREHVAMIEERFGLSVRIEADAHLISPDFSIERFRTATRIINSPALEAGGIEIDTSMPVSEPSEPIAEEASEEEATPSKKRRRRRRRRGRGNGEGEQNNEQRAAEGEASDGDAISEDAPQQDAVSETPDEEAPAPKKRIRRSRKAPKDDVAEEATAGEAVVEAAPEAEEAPAEKPKRRTRRKKADAEADATVEAGGEAGETAEPVSEEKPKRRTRRKKADAEPAVAADSADAGEVTSEVAPEEKPKRRTRKKAEPKVEAPEAEAEAAPAPKKPRKRAAPKAKAEAKAEAEEPAPVVEAEVVAEPVAAAPEPVVAAVEAAPEEPKPEAKKRRGWWSRAMGGK